MKKVFPFILLGPVLGLLVVLVPFLFRAGVGDGIRRGRIAQAFVVQVSKFFQPHPNDSPSPLFQLDESAITLEEALLLQDIEIAKHATVSLHEQRILQNEVDTSECDSLREQYNICLGVNSGCEECLDMVIDSLFVTSNTTSCTDFAIGVCPAIASDCPCGDSMCRQATEDFYECILSVLDSAATCQTLDCNLADPITADPTSAPTPALTQNCPQESNGVNTCPSLTQECVDCVNADYDTLGTQVECADFSVAMCTAIYEHCPCDGCRAEYEAFYDCYITEASNGDCSLDCTAELTNPSPTAIPVSPGLEPDGGSSNAGPIVGGVIGGLALICGTVLGLAFLQKRNQTEVSTKPKSMLVDRSGGDLPADNHYRRTESRAHGGSPTTEVQPAGDSTVSVYATPVSYQSAPPSPLQNAPFVPAATAPSRSPEEILFLNPGSSHVPANKYQVRSVFIPTANATPMPGTVLHRQSAPPRMEDYKRNVPSEWDGSHGAPTRRGLDP